MTNKIRSTSALHVISAVLFCCLGTIDLARSQTASELQAMRPSEVESLQRRLTDAKCFDGATDSRFSVGLLKAIVACPDQRPILRIETGTHVAAIKRIGVDRACQIAATGSDDKTVRLWALPEGRLLRTLRVPISGTNGGRVSATAVSPDGRFVAVGGLDASYERIGKTAVSVFDAANGSLVARVDSFDNVIYRVAFSPDGRWLAATAGGTAGLHIIETATWREVATDRSYRDGAYGVTFAADGRVYTAAFDGKVRVYSTGPTFAKQGEVVTRGGKRPFQVAADPSGTRIAVGFDDTQGVDLYDAPSLAYRGAAETKGIDNGDLSKVAWNSDGTRIIAGGRYQNSGVLAVLFDRDGKRLPDRPPAVSMSTIADFQPCGNGFAVALTDNDFGLLDRTGQVRLRTADGTSDMRAKLGNALQVSADAKVVRFGLGYGEALPVVFDLEKAVLEETPSSAGLQSPRTSGLPVANWEEQFAPTFAGRPIVLDRFETTHALAIRSDRGGFVLGTSSALRAYDASGALRWRRPIPTDIGGANLAKGGDAIVVAYTDGTIRWHRWKDGAELLALFVNGLTKAWVVWTPTGYYKASPGAEDMIGWHVNRGWDQAADFFPASKFRDIYARPDIVDRVLDTLDEPEAIRQANAARPDAKPAKPISDILPPVISIVSPKDGATVEGEEVRIDYLVRSPAGLSVDNVEALVSGRPTSRERGLGRSEEETNALRACLQGTRGLGRTEGGAPQGCRGSINVRLPPGISEIGLFARTGDRTGDIAKLSVTRAVGGSPGEPQKPRLYALVVGISAYADPDMTLQFAAKDARDFSAALENQKGGLYEDIAVRLLADRDASTLGIKDGLEWLAKQLTSHDVGIVYLAGHGLVDDGDRFYFAAADTDAERLRATAVAREDIQDALDALPGRALLFLDASHAGASKARRKPVDMNGVANEFTRTERGVVMFAASTGKQIAQENAAWGNGAFAKAVIEGLGLPGEKGKASVLGNGTISASALDAYVSVRVKELTGGRQSPLMIRPSIVPDFTLAVAR